MKRILIDGRFIGVGESISRYTLEILSGILKLDNVNQYVLLIRPEGNREFKRCFGKNNKLKYPNLKTKILDIPHYSKAEQTTLLKYLNKEKFDLVHFTQFNHPVLYKGEFVITIHDLTMIGHLHRQKLIRRLACQIVMRAAAKNSKKILTVSSTAKDEIVDWYRIDPSKIEVIYNGVDHNKYNSDLKSQTSKIKNFKDKYKISKNYILYTGAWKKHKNIIRMLKAFENVKDKTMDDIQLVLVGKIDKKEPEVTELINKINSGLRTNKDNPRPKSQDLNPIVTTGFIEEDELPIAYAGAVAYIIPSLNEGFGLPPLEAMAVGTPVISSRESCMPEVLGDAPLYFDPYKINEIVKAMQKILSDKKLQKTRITKGLEQAKKYSWNETAKKTFAVYNELLN